MHKNKFKEHSLPCYCGRSSDGLAIDHNGDGFCFSCHKYFSSDYTSRNPTDVGDDFKTQKDDMEEVQHDTNFTGEILYQKVGYRGLSKKTVDHYNITTCFHNDTPHERGFRYPSGAVKVKKYNPLSRKDKYRWETKKGDVFPGVYGRDLFSSKDYKHIYITEGEDDAPSVFQSLGGHSAAVSIQSSSSALRDIESDRDYLNGFERIILAFDADEQGREAVKKVVSAGLFDFNKLYVVEFKGCKDANQFLQEGRTADLVQCLKHAKKYTPDNIINTFTEIEEALKESQEDLIGTYPTDSMNNLLYGLHRGQVVVVKAASGTGKTEVLRMMEYHLLKTSDAKICTIHMEEDKSTTIKGFATYELSVPCALPDRGVTDAQIIEAYKKACGYSEDRVFIYTLFGGDNPDDVLDSIRFVVATGGVDVVFLDHITLLVTGMEEGDERRKLDYLSTKLKKMCKELDFCLVLVSQMNEQGGTRGSKNIEMIADTMIFFDRDKDAEDEYTKNTLQPYVQKNRMSGRIGRVQPLHFSHDTYKLEEISL